METNNYLLFKELDSKTLFIKLKFKLNLNSKMSNPSICIPRVFANIGEQRIRYVFDQLHLGKIARVDMIERRNEQGDTYKRVFIHFEYWFNTRESHAAREKLYAGKEIKVVYDDPWFWKVSINNWNPEPTVRGPHIDWEEDKRPEPSRRPEGEPRRNQGGEPRRTQGGEPKRTEEPRRYQGEPRRPEEPRRTQGGEPSRRYQGEPSRRPEEPRRYQGERRPEEPSRRPDNRREPEDRRRTQGPTKKPEPNAVPIVALPVKQRVLVKKQKKSVELEEGEVVDGELTEEEKQLADALYGDL